MLEPFDPYIEQAAKIKEVPVPGLKPENNKINKKGNKLLRTILFFAFSAIIIGVILNEHFKEKQKMINLKREREKEESN